MKSKILLIAFISIGISAYSQVDKSLNDIPNFTERQPDFEYLSSPDSLGNRVSLKMPNNSNEKSSSSSLPKIPYPIIFIHGLSSDCSVWNQATNYFDSNFGFTYGGRLDFCLNFDVNHNTSNTNFGSPAGSIYDMAIFTPSLNNGDYYFVNFDVGYNGAFHPNGSSSDVKSNQSAVVKQGLAIKWAIYYVLQKTGRDKVILMGHSMGGLAAREYLQNPSNWQADGKTHVAKLVTTGTPHGGSNSTSFGLGAGGVDEQSEAVRDLRRTYYYSLDNGVYLWGGLELQNNSNHMDDNLNFSGIDFYNVDVNCNGVTNQTVVGLNQKSIYTNIDYSCIIGECSGCLLDPNQGDGVVGSQWANLKTIYSTLNVNEFHYYASATTEIHTDLPKLINENLQGLDEPNYFQLAYNVGFDTSYTGFNTIQPVGGLSYDYDDYKFKVNTNSTLTFNVNKTDLTDLMIDIYDSGYNTVMPTIHTNGLSTVTFTKTLNSGDYYLEIYKTPTSTSYYFPYDFIISNSSAISVKELKNNFVTIHPNPTSGLVKIQNKNSENIDILVYDEIGQLVKQSKENQLNIDLDLSDLNNGIYTVKIQNKNAVQIEKIIIVK